MFLAAVVLAAAENGGKFAICASHQYQMPIKNASN